MDPKNVKTSISELLKIAPYVKFSLGQMLYATLSAILMGFLVALMLGICIGWVLCSSTLTERFTSELRWHYAVGFKDQDTYPSGLYQRSLTTLDDFGRRIPYNQTMLTHEQYLEATGQAGVLPKGVLVYNDSAHGVVKDQMLQDGMWVRITSK
jgi:hypothetical protein